jgi:hypothetical protein
MRPTLLVCLLSTTALAAVATAAVADPPARVGRIAYTEGDVSFQPPDAEEWTSATRNFPVAPGEAFWTGDAGRAELQIGSVDARLDSQTELDIVDVDYGDMRLGLPQGSLDIRLWSMPRRPVIIATPAGDVRLDASGLYRIDVGAPQDGYYPPVEVTVFDGAAEAPAPEGLAPVQPGQAALIYAGYDPQFQYAQGAAIDDWGRDLEARLRWRPTDDASAALTGLGDLYAAGQFVDDPDYGQVWFPRDVPYGWAPYRYGHWAYVEPWGYTWIDDQPWGFAPFHYGRWAQIGGRWGWVPGRPTPEPVYAPALVAFFGGLGWRVGDSDAIGWAPLAPNEDYRPGYAISDDYRRRLNQGAFRGGYPGPGAGAERPPQSYRNVGAATVVRAGDFSSARPVRAAALSVAPNLIAAAPASAPQSRPPPSPWARTGMALRQGAGPAPPPPPIVARPPPALAAVRRAVVAPAPAQGRPPVIAGARIAPSAPPSASGPGRPAAAMIIAPAQLRRPQGSSGPPMAPPRAASPAAAPASAQAAGAQAAAQRAEAAQAAARAQAEAAGAQAARAKAAQQAGQEAAQARAAQAQATERARADQERQGQMQAEQARARAAQAQAAQAQAAQAQAREAQAQAQAREAQAAQARQAQDQAEAAARARAAQAPRPQPQPQRPPPPQPAKPQAEPDVHKKTDRGPPPQP